MKIFRWLLLLTLLLPMRLAGQSPASADSAWKRGDMVTAERMYSWILKQDSSDVVALYRYALTQAWQKRYAVSLHLFDRLLAIDPEDAYVKVGRARVLAWSGERRAAMASLDTVLAAHPKDADARELRLTIARWSMRTAVTPAFVYEGDSEDNRIANLRTGLLYAVSDALELRADAYLRNTDQDVAGAQSAYGATAAVWQRRSPTAWTWFVAAGASTADASNAPTYPIVRAYVLTPRDRAAQGSLTFAHGPLDLTSLLIQKQVTTTELAGAVNFGHDTLTSGSISVSTTAYDSRTSGRDNRRTAATASILRQITPAVQAGVAARAFGFSQALTDGYFDPDFYGSAELLARFEQSGRRVAFNGELAPGLQQVNKGGATTATIRGTGRLSYTFAVGRSLEAFATYAQSGMNQVSQQTSARYRYHAFGISANWIF